MNVFFFKNIAGASIEYQFDYLEDMAKFQCLHEQLMRNVEILRSQYYTYGGLNTDLLVNAYCVNGYSVEPSAVSATFDAQLELLMPDVWYVNGGRHFLNTALYFNKVQKGKENNTKRKRVNKDIAEVFGYFGMVEAFRIDDLQARLKADDIKAFSVIKTIPECARVLEANIEEDIFNGGYENGRYTRLVPYIDAARHYYDLMEKNKELIRGYDKSNFFLGMAETQKIIDAEGTSPVRRYFVDLWQKVLVNHGIDPDHSEIIIVGREFSLNRQPNFVIVGESDDHEQQEGIINSDFAYGNVRKIYVSYAEPDKYFDLIKRNGEKWNYDPEVYLLSLVLLNEAGHEEEFQAGLKLYNEILRL